MSCCRKFWQLAPPLRRSGFQIDILLIFSYLTLVLLFFSYFLTGENIIAFKDLSRYFYPLRHLMLEQVRAGHLPLWNPYIFCGYPLMATLQVGFFYPLTIIYSILPFNLAFNYYIILHYFLAACFMYMLLRRFQLRRSSAYLGGLVFAFSGYLLSVSNMNTSLSSVIWLPLVVLVWDRIIKSEFPNVRNQNIVGIFGFRISDLIILALLMAIMFLGGEPTIIYVTLWFLFFYGLVFAQNKLKAVGLLVLAVLIFIGLAAVQIIPFAELALQSERVTSTQFEMISSRSLPLRETIGFILPYFYGNAAQMGSYTEALLGKINQDWLISPYLGVLPLIFVFFSLRGRKPFFFLAAALLALLLAFGRYTPFYQIIFQVPGVSLLRYPVKFLFLVNFCLCLLAAFGFERLCARPKPFKALFSLLFVCVTLSLLGYFYSQAIFLFLARQYSTATPNYFFELLSQLIRFNLQSLVNLSFYLAAFILLFWLARRKKISKMVFIGGTILLTAADLFANGAAVGVSAKAEVFNKTPQNYEILIKDKGLYRLFYSPKVESDNKLINGENYSAAIFNAKDNFAANWPMLNHLFDFHGYESIKPREFSKFYYALFSEDKLPRNLKYLSYFNVKYLVLNEKPTLPGLKLLRHKHEYGINVYLYENRNVLPRAFFLGPGNRPERGGVIFQEYRPGKIVMQVATSLEKTLFLSEIYYPGWKAYVDGRETQIVKANAFFSALKVPAGSREVKYVYAPMSFKLGAGISLLSMVLLSAFGFRLSKSWGGQRELNP